jgi:hypothetical protein
MVALFEHQTEHKEHIEKPRAQRDLCHKKEFIKELKID